MLCNIVREVCHLMKNTLKLWDHVGNMPDEIHKAMVECLQVFKITVHY